MEDHIGQSKSHQKYIGYWNRHHIRIFDCNLDLIKKFKTKEFEFLLFDLINYENNKWYLFNKDKNRIYIIKDNNK